MDLGPIVSQLAPMILEKASAQLKMGLERAVQEHGSTVVSQLFEQVIPALRDRLIARMTPEPPASFQAALIAQGWNLDDKQTRVLWFCVFRALCNAPVPDSNAETPTGAL